MLILGIETSCDETAVGIVDADMRCLANPLYSQLDEHRPFGGVVPELAARTHQARLPGMLQEALDIAQCRLGDIGAIAFTRGPGLNGPLLVGAAFAQALAMDLGVPALGMNHLEGHIAAAFLSSPELKPPFVCLTVSGGHTELTLVEEGFRYTRLGATRDDAAGEAFDKSGKILGLGYPAGATIGALAQKGRRDAFELPRAMMVNGSLEFSFSGLKTAVLRLVQAHDEKWREEHLPDLCASVEAAIVDVLVRKSKWALRQSKQTTVVVCGGVSANRSLREHMQAMGKRSGLRVLFPDFQYCTDNGAMIAAAAQFRLQNGWDIRTAAKAVSPRLPLGA